MKGFARGITNLAEQATAAKELEAKLTAGQMVVELDPHLIDGSFIADRMMYDGDAYQALRGAIEERGQESPILVRPHPEANDRYQIAFGHRRQAVAKDLGRSVRAVVKNLSDEELVLAQGQENSARADLSFIERARFARRLQDHGYARSLIMAALSVDKTEVSKMIAVTERLSTDVIDAIGAAPSMGRDRWLQLSARLQGGLASNLIMELLASEAFRSASSDERFTMVAEKLIPPGVESEATDPAKAQAGVGQGACPDARYWGPAGKGRVVKATETRRSYLLAIDQESAPGFGEFLLSHMDRLFAEYATTRAKS
jgi:ParB family transcriptional regulator, chromosome partitioning protein